MVGGLGGKPGRGSNLDLILTATRHPGFAYRPLDISKSIKFVLLLFVFLFVLFLNSKGKINKISCLTLWSLIVILKNSFCIFLVPVT